MSSELESDVCYCAWRRLVKATEITAGLAESTAWWMVTSNR